MSNTKILKMISAENWDQIEFTFLKMSLQKVDLPDFLFDSGICISDDCSALMPPIIVCKNESGYTIIDGCKRFLQLRKNGVKEATFAIVNITLDLFSSAALRIYLNRGRALQVREKIQFISWLKKNCGSDNYRQIVMELGISDRERFELEQLAECSLSILESVDKGYSDCGIVSDLKKFKEADCQACLHLFSKISLSRQQQRELVEWLPEVAFSASISVEEVLAADELKGIVASDKINQPQKAQKVREYVFQKRFPHLVKVKKVWSEFVNKVNPDPARINFSASEAFEKNRLEIRIILTEAEKAILLFEKLGSISKDRWEKLIYPGSYCE